MEYQASNTHIIDKQALKQEGIKEVLKIDGVNSFKDVKLTIEKETNKIVLDVYIIVNYGCKIPDVAWNVQETIRSIAAKYSNKVPEIVNIHISGVKEKEIKNV